MHHNKLATGGRASEAPYEPPDLGNQVLDSLAQAFSGPQAWHQVLSGITSRSLKELCPLRLICVYSGHTC